jgi:hypothetical protein
MKGVDMTTAAKKVKTTAAVFELPQRLGVLQYVEYESPRGWCASDGCLFEGVLKAEGCRKGVCVRCSGFIQGMGGGGRLGGGGGVAETRAGASGNRWLTPCGRWLYCRSVEDCVGEMLRVYKRGVEKMRGRLLHNPAEGLLRKCPELEAFGADWVRAWAPHVRERLAEIAEVTRRCPWMAEVVRQKPVDNPRPYMV